ncbi:hypothetical protein BCAR13_790088 [Paraburkholderia caribensis]|nr:hypothetical protein BCAR13_790088 [Paraburkholderia caribensis]
MSDLCAPAARLSDVKVRQHSAKTAQAKGGNLHARPAAVLLQTDAWRWAWPACAR